MDRVHEQSYALEESCEKLGEEEGCFGHSGGIEEKGV